MPSRTVTKITTVASQFLSSSVCEKVRTPCPCLLLYDAIMTHSTRIPKARHIADGVRTDFPLTFALEDELIIEVNGTSRNGTVSADETYVRISPAPVDGAVVVLFHRTPITQPRDLSARTVDVREEAERGLDRLTRMVEEMECKVESAMRLPLGYTQDPLTNAKDTMLVGTAAGTYSAYGIGSPSERGGTVLGFASDGTFARFPIGTNIETSVSFLEQNLTLAQQKQARINIGIDSPIPLTASAAELENYYEVPAIVPHNKTFTIPFGSGRTLKNQHEAMAAIANWYVPASSEVRLQGDPETFESTPYIIQWDVRTPNRVILCGTKPESKSVVADGNHSFSGDNQDYSVVFELDNVSNISVGDFLRNNASEEFDRSPGNESNILFDQSGAFWPFTPIQRDHPGTNGGTSRTPNGFLQVIGTQCTIMQRTNGETDPDLIFQPSPYAIANDYVSVGDILDINGEFVEITVVSSTGPDFELVRALAKDVTGPIAYWYTLKSETGTITQSGTTITGQGTDFLKAQRGDFIAANGIYNVITRIDSATSCEVLVSEDIDVAEAYALVRNPAVLGGTHPIIAVDTESNLVTIKYHGYLGSIDVPVKGIIGGTVQIMKTVFKSDTQGIAVDCDTIRLKDVVLSGPFGRGIAIEPGGTNGTNNGHVVCSGFVSMYQFHVGLCNDAGMSSHTKYLHGTRQTYTGCWARYGEVSGQFMRFVGCSLYGMITSGSSVYANFLGCSANASQGVLVATPTAFVADSIETIANRRRGVTVQSSIFHLVQLKSYLNDVNFSVTASTGRCSGFRILGGGIGAVIANSNVEGHSGYMSGQSGVQALVTYGAVFDMLSGDLRGSNKQGAVVSRGAKLVLVTGSASKNTGLSIQTGSRLDCDNAVIDAKLTAVSGGTIYAPNISGDYTTNITPDELQPDKSLIHINGGTVFKPA